MPLGKERARERARCRMSWVWLAGVFPREFTGVSDGENFSVRGPKGNNAAKSTCSFYPILALILAPMRDPREMAMLVNNKWGRSEVPCKVQAYSSLPETPVGGCTVDVKGTEVNSSLLLEWRFARGAFMASVTATEMAVARALTFSCIIPESI